MLDEQFPLALSYDDVLLVPQFSDIKSRSDVDLSTHISPKLKLKIPMISTKMDTITGVEMAVAMGKLGGMGILPRFDTLDIQVANVKKVREAGVVAAAAVGVKNGYMERAEALIQAGATVIDIDVAHGHMKQTIEATINIKRRFGDSITLISGITSTYECADDLYTAGADAVLVGVGSGSICTTRIMTGFGVPGLTSLVETARAAKKHKKTFIPDAGIRNSGDIVKALATGASAIVGGNIFAGTDETPGDIIEYEGKLYKKYNGSASQAEKINQVEKDPTDKPAAYVVHVEGVEGLMAYRGPISDWVNGLLAGVRSGLSYAGARNIPELWEKAKFIRVTTGGLKESNAHDIIIKLS
ncbi:MAG: GMP reductase [candidate division WWE3 bacterium GW2011_GWB1_41_6]|uniref:GMP reductase n=1 Tax=candidate division WWE3 bacterium GW2011_GWB1_41_6 TaxID=1619112 RepID=A0A0G0WPV8_UNCKA|nr:MAG: GMP reductase [candidate division WWE3 bacterium GW2011_GWB1_41_6]